jgi:hypothetical protein
MPIVRTSNSGETQTTIIFTESEIEALRYLLHSGKFEDTEESDEAIELLRDLEYGLDICFHTV